MTIKAENTSVGLAAQRDAFEHFDAMRQRRDDRQPPPDASEALPLTQAAETERLARLLERDGGS